jgi:hypothetical protein
MATLKPLKPLLSNNYVRVVALTPNLRAACFYDAREFFHYSSVINLLLFLILMKGFYSIL